MQNAKDSFYMALRNRLQIKNSLRTILIRGMIRPGILVEEAEAPLPQIPSDVFVLRWSGMGTDQQLRTTLVAEECEIVYQSGGSAAFGGLDRGRCMCTMDAELLSILAPQATAKMNYLTSAPVQMQTQVFWDEPLFAPLTTHRELLSRSVKVTVFSYQEEGE